MGSAMQLMVQMLAGNATPRELLVLVFIGRSHVAGSQWSVVRECGGDRKKCGGHEPCGELLSRLSTFQHATPFGATRR